MKKIGIIGGTTLSALSGAAMRPVSVTTPFGESSSPYAIAPFHGVELVFLARHGVGHTIPPHLINYRANLWGMRELGVEAVIAFATVGGISPEMAPGVLVLPDQIIDYTHGRPDTFYDQDFSIDRHIDFTEPYDPGLRRSLESAAGRAGLRIVPRGAYGVTQGPRLETSAEIRRMAHDGCDMVGMTGMPEAALARELALPYACCAVVVNWAAGLSPAQISIEEIRAIAHQANAGFWNWLESLVTGL